MLKVVAMGDNRRKTNDGVLRDLKELFGSVLHIDIIRSVASQCNFDVSRSSNLLLEMTNNVHESPIKKKDKKIKKPPQQQQQQPAPTPKKKLQPSTSTTTLNKSTKQLNLERVIGNIRKGYKVLVILRGLPGSGKSVLARTITDATLGPGDNSPHILSTDDFFEQRAGYGFDPSMLQEAHGWNHQRAFTAMSRGFSPVIIDNTNTQIWEMKPYAIMATDSGYMIEIVEPDTYWCFNDKELAKRNNHNVPKTKIREMLDRYEKNVTTHKLLAAYNLRYKFQKPPQFRRVPPLNQRYQEPDTGIPKSQSTSVLNRQNSASDSNSNSPDAMETINLMDFEEVSEGVASNNNAFALNAVDEILMYREDNLSNVLQPNQAKDKEPLGFNNDIESAWGVDAKTLQSWDIVRNLDYNTKPEVFASNDYCSATMPEMHDVNIGVDPRDWDVLKTGLVPNGFKVIRTQGRDINSLWLPPNFHKVSKKMTLDKSCLTDEEIVDVKDEPSHLNDLKDLFPKVGRRYLKEMYDKCHKNFNWTVDILLEDNSEDVPDDNELDLDDEVVVNEDPTHDEPVEEFAPIKRKFISEDAVELKRCLESKIDINREHYSEHVLNVKQLKFGAYADCQPSTSSGVTETCDLTSDSDSDSSNNDDPKNMVEFNLGEGFVSQLETVFGGSDMAFPQGFQPAVQMPIGLARQIYSLYIESICQQMETQHHVLEQLVQEDEEFARKLQRQEEEEAAPPPRAPSFNEIMDEQVALSLHKRDVDEWKNMTADNLAARMTRQKLFSVFPNVDREALLEILHAYGNDYNKAVADLVTSVGSEDINGARDSIAEPPLSKSTIDEMKAAEKDCADIVEAQGGEPRPATYFREEANKHLQRRQQLYEQAQTYYQRGLSEVARFYSELAKKETRSYDQANHIAAVAFVEEHSRRLQKFDTLDLHYLYVKEAIPQLDIFIDRNINLLQGTAKNGQELFVITGRGKNSVGGRSKIKPAVMTRLKKRRIDFSQLNPGLLKIKVMKNSFTTSDLASSS